MEKIERGNMPTQKVIQKHWYSEVTGDKASYWANTLGDLSYEVILEDNGCSCYACGRHSKHLQRCHIVPHMLGGGVEPSNLMLLCEECHQGNPDTKHPDMFFNYVKHVPFWFEAKWDKMYRHFSNLVDSADLDSEKKFKEFIASDKCCIEFVNSVCHGEMGVGLNNKVSNATVASLVWKGITA